jgi:hypothetical protein
MTVGLREGFTSTNALVAAREHAWVSDALTDRAGREHVVLLVFELPSKSTAPTESRRALTS